MSIVFNAGIETISVDNIDINNRDYKISRPLSDDKLKLSIQSSGMLDLPFLLKNDNYYIIVFGHNRINLLKDLNIKTISSYIIDELDEKTYINSVLLKNFRNELGQIGKIKAIRIIKNKFTADENKISSIAKKMMIPDEFLRHDIISKVLALPEDLKVYIETKDIGFKVLKNVLRLPENAYLFLSKWVNNLNMRVNIFKGITENIFDIYKRDNNINKVIELDIDLNGDKRKKEEELFSEIFKLRFPEYANTRHKVDYIIDKLKGSGVEINFPEYHEKDEIAVTVKINKREDISLFKNRFEQIGLNSLKELLDLM